MPTFRRPPSSGPKIRILKGLHVIREAPDRRSGFEDRKGERRIQADRRANEFRPMLEKDLGRTVPAAVWQRTRELFRVAWFVDSKAIMDAVGEWRVVGPFPDKETPYQDDTGPRTIRLENLKMKKRVLIKAERNGKNVKYYISTTHRTRADDRRKYDRRSGNGFTIKKI